MYTFKKIHLQIFRWKTHLSIRDRNGFANRMKTNLLQVHWRIIKNLHVKR